MNHHKMFTFHFFISNLEQCIHPEQHENLHIPFSHTLMRMAFYLPPPLNLFDMSEVALYRSPLISNSFRFCHVTFCLVRRGSVHRYVE